MAGNCQSSECVETQLSSTKQKVGLDGDTVVADYVSKLNYDIKASDNRCSVIKGQQFHSSKFEKVLRLSRKWAQKEIRPRRSAKIILPILTLKNICLPWPAYKIHSYYTYTYLNNHSAFCGQKRRVSKGHTKGLLKVL